MRSFPVWVPMTVLALLASACAPTTPTSVLLEIDSRGPVDADELRLDIFAPEGVALRGQRVPASGVPALPGQLVLYPPLAGVELRLHLVALAANAILAAGSGRVVPVSGAQTRLKVWLEAGALPDSDGDGVPDDIDNCPSWPNPEQQPCPVSDGGIDGDHGPEADGSPHDLEPDAPPDLFIEPDIVRPCTSAAQCTDGNACTEDRCEGGFCTYGPVLCKPSGNPCRQAPRCDKSAGCVEDPKPDDTPCADTLYCTVNEKCAGGSCQTDPRDCAATAPVCRTAVGCNEATDTCTYSLLAAGTSCDDGDACTQEDACSAGGTCVAPPLTVTPVATLDVSLNGDRTLIVDAAGVTHFIYNTASAALHYVTDASGSWVDTVLDSATATATYATLARDAQGALHAIYARGGLLRHATFQPGATTLTQLESAGASLGHCAAAFDAAGLLHVAHRRANSIWHSSRATTGAWTHEEVWAAPGTATQEVQKSSLAIDAAGKLHIAFGFGSDRMVSPVAYTSENLRHATNESGSWVVTVVPPTTGPAGVQPSLVILPNGSLQIAHGAINASGSSGALLLTTRSPSGVWSVQTVASGQLGDHAALIAGNANRLHVVYRAYASDEFYYQSYAGNAWSTPLLLNTGGQTGRWNDLTRKPSGRLLAATEQTSELRLIDFSACP